MLGDDCELSSKDYAFAFRWIEPIFKFSLFSNDVLKLEFAPLLFNLFIKHNSQSPNKRRNKQIYYSYNLLVFEGD